MIAATLEFVENETRMRPREALDLALLVEGVVDDLADLGRDVSLARAAPATVLGDPLLLKRLFANLINNAVTYGHRATVTLDVRDSEAIVEVTDEGPGLSPVDLDRAFEPFYRAEASRNRSIFAAEMASLSSERAKSNSASNMNRGGSARSKKMKSLYWRIGASVAKFSSRQSESSSRRPESSRASS